MSSKLDLSHKPRQREGIEAHNLLDEAVLYLPGQELGVSLNRSARAIWELCDGSRTVTEISRELGQEAGCPEEELLADIEAAVRQFKALDLIDLIL
jgi:hypothetical protein